jgi:hypothetical protein
MAAFAVLTCRVLLIGVFAVAAGSKLIRHGFAEFEVSTGRLLPVRWSGWRRPAAVGVLAGEVATVGLLAWSVTAPVGFGLAVGLSLAFAAGIGAALRRKQRAPCRCFGTSATPLGRTHLVRNAAVSAAAVTGLALMSLTPPGAGHPAGAALAVLVGAVLAALVVRIDDLVALFAPLPT